MDAGKMPEMQKGLEHQYITEDSKTRVYLSLVREFSEQEYEAYCTRKKKAALRRKVIFIAHAMKYILPVVTSWILYHYLSCRLFWERGGHGVGSEIFLVGIVGAVIYLILDRIVGGDEN